MYGILLKNVCFCYENDENDGEQKTIVKTVEGNYSRTCTLTLIFLET